MDESHEHHHTHGHQHAHNHQNGQSLTEINRAHWNEKAADYTSEAFQKQFGDLINKITAFILSNINWIGVDFLDPAATFEKPGKQRTVRFLDYACGPGTLTAALTGYVSEYVGIDLSEKMVEQYNQRFAPVDEKSSGEEDTTGSALNAHALVGNLLSGDKPPTEFQDPKYFNFDLVAVGLGFHHFENLEEVMRRLVERVKPGGTFLITDFLPHDKGDMGPDVAHMIAHHGFTEDRVRDLFTGAGLVNVDLVIMKEPVLLRNQAWRTPFLARGQKPADST